jgi:hypothetical protein
VDDDDWTKGICAYSGLEPTSADPIKKVCPNRPEAIKGKPLKKLSAPGNPPLNRPR